MVAKTIFVAAGGFTLFDVRTPTSVFLVVALVVGLMAWDPSPAISVDRQAVDQACAASQRALSVVEDGAARLDEAVRRYVEINIQLEEQSLETFGLRAAADEKADVVSGLRAVVNDQAIGLYMSGSATQGSSLLASKSLTDFLTGRQMLSGLSERTFDAAVELEGQIQDLLALNEELQANNEELDDLRDELEQLALETNQALEAAQMAYFDLDTECARLYNEYQAELRRIEAERVANATGGLPLEATPGFVCPVNQPFSFINDWGFSRDGGRRSHKGTDVFTPYGQEQYAVANGTIELLSGGLGGTAIWLVSDYGVRFYYAHMSGYAPGLTNGQAVAIGDLVGYTGNSGNARTTPPHLHFGIRASTGQWVNPYPTLARTCG